MIATIMRSNFGGFLSVAQVEMLKLGYMSLVLQWRGMTWSQTMKA